MYSDPRTRLCRVSSLVVSAGQSCVLACNHHCHACVLPPAHSLAQKSVQAATAAIHSRRAYLIACEASNCWAHGPTLATCVQQRGGRASERSLSVVPELQPCLLLVFLLIAIGVLTIGAGLEARAAADGAACLARGTASIAITPALVHCQ